MPYNFLLASWSGPGVLAPLLTAARQLRSKGHNVRLIGDTDMRDEVEAAKFGFAAWRPQESRTKGAMNVSGPAGTAQILSDVAIGPAAAYAADTRDELARAPADALLATDILLGSVIGAEAAGVPCAIFSPHVSMRPLPGVPFIASGLKAPHTATEHSEVAAANKEFTAALNELLPGLNKVRADFGLPPLADVFDLFDRADRVLLAISRAFDLPAQSLPDNMRYTGPLLDPPGWSKPWISPWPQQSGRPRALVSFSTGFQDQVEALQHVVTAIGGIDMDAVVTTGPALEGVALHAPDNVILRHSAPHDAVMKEISLVVTHGGHGTVSRALIHGLPMLVIPQGRDQHDNASRVEHHGAGLALPPAASGEEIRNALNRLIKEPQFRVAAQRLGAAISEDLKATALVDEMEAIAASRAKQENVKRFATAGRR